MAIPATLDRYLRQNGVSYYVIKHHKTSCSRMNARATHVPEESVAKAVVIKRRKGFVLAVVPASREVALRGLGALLAQPVCLATEQELQGLFTDCEVGAVPPLGQAYGIRTVVDRQLLDRDDIYFEGGDHRTVVHLKGRAFRRLMDKVPHRNISRQGRSSGARSESGDLSYWGA
jgi:Ala-tRNA(Pro) deacylase